MASSAIIVTKDLTHQEGFNSFFNVIHVESGCAPDVMEKILKYYKTNEAVDAMVSHGDVKKLKSNIDKTESIGPYRHVKNEAGVHELLKALKPTYEYFYRKDPRGSNEGTWLYRKHGTGWFYFLF